MEVRAAQLKMIQTVTGGWEVAAAHLGMTVNALRNRAYNVKGQVLLDEHSLALQVLSETTFYAEAIALASGGVFLKLPNDPLSDNVDLMNKFQDLYAELGTFSGHFKEATADEKIDRREQKTLEQDAARMHKVLGELLQLMIHVYAPRSDREAA